MYRRIKKRTVREKRNGEIKSRNNNTIVKKVTKV